MRQEESDDPGREQRLDHAADDERVEPGLQHRVQVVRRAELAERDREPGQPEREHDDRPAEEARGCCGAACGPTGAGPATR